MRKYGIFFKYESIATNIKAIIDAKVKIFLICSSISWLMLLKKNFLQTCLENQYLPRNDGFVAEASVLLSL